MLTKAVESYIAVRRATGFAFRSEGSLLKSFAAFSKAAGMDYVCSETAIQWAGSAPLLSTRARRLGQVIRFARYIRAEDPHHEMPPAVFGSENRPRPVPYIFSSDEIQRILHAASELGKRNTFRGHTYQTFFALLACTGLRVSEAIRLCFQDITGDGLVIRCSKFRKSRLVPLHQTTEAGLEEYLKRRRAYRSDWRHFCAWCEVHAQCPLPASAEAVASYIAECAAHLKPGSIQRRLNAIAEAHKVAGAESPTHAGMVVNTMKGIRRALGTAPVQKAAALTEDIRAMVAATDSGIIGARDRALILLGFAGAFRRSELVGLDVEDCSFSRDGLTETLRRSKMDPTGLGRNIGIPYGSNPDTCPVRMLQAWLELAAITTGPLFRSINRHGQLQPGRLAGIDVARVVKKLAERAGLDAGKYAGHSLRAGHATTAAIAGASERSIMNQTGHRSVQMVRRYIRDGSLFRENSAGKLGL